MANTYLSTGASVGNTYSALYNNGDPNITSIVKSLYFCNTSTGTYYVSAKTELTYGGTEITLINSGQVPPNTTLQVLDGNLVLNGRCDLSIKADTASVIEATASILEIS